MARTIHDIAEEIREDWGGKVSPYAAPYLDAMKYLNTPADNYGADSGSYIVSYFLANAASWRGATARRIKAELRQMVNQ